MTDDELKALVDIIRLHTALGRLSWRETADAIRFIEANGYSISGPQVEASSPPPTEGDASFSNTFTSYQAGGNRQSVE